MTELVRGMFMGSNRYKAVAGFAAGIFLCFAANSCFSATYKCKDSKGQTIYSDRSCASGATPIQVQNNGMARPPENSIIETKLDDAKLNRKYSDKCSFTYYTYSDDKGKTLAAAAKDECYRNEILKESGKSAQISLEAYNLWMDHKIVSKRATPKTTHCTPDYAGGMYCR